MIPVPPAVLLAAALVVAGLAPAQRLEPVPPITAPAGSQCGEWYGVALAAGWPAEEWPTVDRVMRCESRCEPAAYNRSSASGLMQVLARWFPAGADPFDPATNLAVALDVWHRQGWKAWSCW